MKRILTRALKITVGVGLLFGLYVLGMILYATYNDYKPEEKLTIEVEGKNNQPMSDTLSLLNWNIGYSGLGKEVDFFYDGGKTVVSPKDIVTKDLGGIVATIATNKADFILLQEVDENSNRSYYIEEDKKIAEALPGYNSAFAVNYDVKFVPIPFNNPMGKVLGGLVTYSKYTPKECSRFQYPSQFGWPKQLFMLDRCMMIQRYDVKNDKELVVINLHNSAYDDTGTLKKAEMNYLKSYITGEYAKDNYVIIGGDWNQTPPGFDNNTFKKSGGEDSYVQEPIKADYLPKNWQWVYDSTIPTNRKLAAPYDPNKTFTTVIDFYLVSPNVQVLEKKGVNTNFEFSDHQPVYIKVVLL